MQPRGARSLFEKSRILLAWFCKRLIGFDFVLQTDAALTFGLIAAVDGEFIPIVTVAADPTPN